MTEQQRIRNLRVPDGTVDAVLDTDAFNEIDDQYALAYLLASDDKIRLQALYAAPFFNDKSASPKDGMEKSYREILNILDLAGKGSFQSRTYRGSETYLPDERTPVVSDAAAHLAELAARYSPDRPLYVVAIGAITNVASALLMKPEIAENIVIVWLGGHAFHCDDTREFNMIQDIAAARVVCGCGAPLVLLPCVGVVDQFRTTGPELVHWLAGKNPLCDYLVQNTVNEAESYAKGKPWSRVIWDVTAVAWLLNDGGRFLDSRLEPSPIPQYDGHYSFDSRRHPLRYVTQVNRDCLFEDVFMKLSKLGG